MTHMNPHMDVHTLQTCGVPDVVPVVYQMFLHTVNQVNYTVQGQSSSVWRAIWDTRWRTRRRASRAARGRHANLEL